MATTDQPRIREPQGSLKAEGEPPVAAPTMSLASEDPSTQDEDNDPLKAESVYTNLIITEHALRSQYIELQRSRRRGLLFFWGVVAGAAVLTYRVRYDASIYQFIRLIEQLLMIATYISCGLFFLTGMYTKVFAVAPRFLADTNKGLKTLNFRIVRCPTTLKEKLVRLLDPVYTEDPAGPVKLVLSPREFAPHFIEDWEIFRNEYWERQRRRRQRLKKTRRKGDSKKNN